MRKSRFTVGKGQHSPNLFCLLANISDVRVIRRELFPRFPNLPLWFSVVVIHNCDKRPYHFIITTFLKFGRNSMELFFAKLGIALMFKGLTFTEISSIFMKHKGERVSRFLARPAPLAVNSVRNFG